MPRPALMHGERSPTEERLAGMSSIRVLVVEDHQSFQQLICSMLGKRPDLQVIGRVSDGLEAVRKAEELQPDLILLDIGLPTLSGIEAARRIRKLSPGSKIIFLTQEGSADIVREALDLGAKGYVVKASAGSELLAAVDAVLRGREFVSKGLLGHTPTDAAETHVADSRRRDENLLSSAPVTIERTRSHKVRFYIDDASFLDGFVGFIEAALQAGDAVIVIATESHQKGLLQRLRNLGLDIAAAIEQRRYIPLDVDQSLSTFMRNDLPDPGRFRKAVGDLVATVANATPGKPRRVSACGEYAPTLWARGNGVGAIQVEHLWDEMAKACGIDTLCGYVLNSFQREQENTIYESICAEHSTVCSQ